MKTTRSTVTTDESTNDAAAACHTLTRGAITGTRVVFCYGRSLSARFETFVGLCRAGLPPLAFKYDRRPPKRRRGTRGLVPSSRRSWAGREFQRALALMAGCPPFSCAGPAFRFVEGFRPLSLRTPCASILTSAESLLRDRDVGDLAEFDGLVDRRGRRVGVFFLAGLLSKRAFALCSADAAETACRGDERRRMAGFGLRSLEFSFGLICFLWEEVYQGHITVSDGSLCLS